MQTDAVACERGRIWLFRTNGWNREFWIIWKFLVTFLEYYNTV